MEMEGQGMGGDREGGQPGRREGGQSPDYYGGTGRGSQYSLSNLSLLSAGVRVGGREKLDVPTVNQRMPGQSGRGETTLVEGGGRMRHPHHKVSFSWDPKVPTHTVPCPYEGDSPMWPLWRKQLLWESSWEPQ